MKFLSRLTKLFSVCLASSIVLVSNSLCFAMEEGVPPTPIIRALSSRSLNALRPSITIGPKYGEVYTLIRSASNMYGINRGGRSLYTIQVARAAGKAIYSIINTDTGITMFRIYSDGITYIMKSVATLSEETDYAKFEVKDGERVISMSNAGEWGHCFTVKQGEIRINRYGICYDNGSGEWKEDSAVTVRGDFTELMPVAFLLAGTILK